MIGWHHRLDGHEFEKALGVGDGQGSLACCSPWRFRVKHDWATKLTGRILSKLFMPLCNLNFSEYPLGKARWILCLMNKDSESQKERLQGVLEGREWWITTFPGQCPLGPTSLMPYLRDETTPLRPRLNGVWGHDCYGISQCAFLHHPQKNVLFKWKDRRYLGNWGDTHLGDRGSSSSEEVPSPPTGVIVYCALPLWLRTTAPCQHLDLKCSPLELWENKFLSF